MTSQATVEQLIFQMKISPPRQKLLLLHQLQLPLSLKLQHHPKQKHQLLPLKLLQIFKLQNHQAPALLLIKVL
jgi:hypothetical protein